MTLIDDSLEAVKASILVAIKKELIETYPVEFGDYKTGRDDMYTKVFWADTIRYQPKFPYCMITPQKDISEGYEEIYHFKDTDGITRKRNVTRSFLTATIDVFDMGCEASGKSSLVADTFAHKVARQLRKYFNGDGKLDWFSGNEYYPRQIGITVETDIASIIDWSDTDTLFKYSFDVKFGWDDVQDSSADLAKGAYINVYENNKQIENLEINF